MFLDHITPHSFLQLQQDFQIISLSMLCPPYIFSLYVYMTHGIQSRRPICTQAQSHPQRHGQPPSSHTPKGKCASLCSFQQTIAPHLDMRPQQRCPLYAGISLILCECLHNLEDGNFFLVLFIKRMSFEGCLRLCAGAGLLGI